MSDVISKHKIGDKVFMPGYTDCFDVRHPDTSPLIVVRLQLIKPTLNDTLKPYYRVLTQSLDLSNTYEGSERFFAPIPEEN